MEKQNLTEKIEKYFELRAALKRIEELVVPPFVNRPIACKANEWNSYLVKKNEYDQAVHTKSVELKEVETSFSKIKSQLREMLPVSNVWFVTDNDKYAIGHQSCDWPMSDGTLMIEKNPKIEELNEIVGRVSNSN